MSMAGFRMPGLAMIAGLTDERVIGRGLEIPFRYPEDMKHFRTVTAGHAVIMGRTTYDSIGKPLKGRRNIVVTRNRDLRIEGVEIAHDVPSAIALARTSDPAPMIIGGAQIYELALPYATRLYLTYVHVHHEGDVLFPQHDPSEWRQVERRESGELSFVTLERAGAVGVSRS
jgi:dihydrofolate reductase